MRTRVVSARITTGGDDLGTGGSHAGGADHASRYRYNMVSAINNKAEMRFMLTTRGVDTPVFIEF